MNQRKYKLVTVLNRSDTHHNSWYRNLNWFFLSVCQWLLVAFTSSFDLSSFAGLDLTGSDLLVAKSMHAWDLAQYVLTGCAQFLRNIMTPKLGQNGKLYHGSRRRHEIAGKFVLRLRVTLVKPQLENNQNATCTTDQLPSVPLHPCASLSRCCWPGQHSARTTARNSLDCISCVFPQKKRLHLLQVLLTTRAAKSDANTVLESVEIHAPLFQVVFHPPFAPSKRKAAPRRYIWPPRPAGRCPVGQRGQRDTMPPGEFIVARADSYILPRQQPE